MNYDYDVAVIGGGPGGYVAAIAAAKEGKKTCLFEERRVGGVCLNEGCIPTKALLKSAAVLRTIKEAKNFGVCANLSDEIQIDMIAVQNRKNAVINQLVGGMEFLLKANKVEVFNSSASFSDSHTLKYDKGEVSADNIIIASGSKVFRLPIEIAEDAKVFTSRELLDLDYLPKQVAIIGGGVVGVEFAFFLAGAGVKVTILELMNEILPMVDAEVISQVRNVLKRNGIQVITDAAVKRIERDHVIYVEKDEKKTVAADFTVMAAGRVPRTAGLNLEAVGIEMNKRAVAADEYLRTNVPHIYAIGDVNGKSMLAHTASKEAEVAVHNICGQKEEMDYRFIPSCIYLSPEIACVGITEIEAQKQGKNVRIGKFPLSANGKALIEGEPAGVIKVIIDKDTDKILGVHIFGVHSTDMISGLTIAMTNGLKATDIIASVFPHPTVSEIIHEACLAAYGKAIHIK